MTREFIRGIRMGSTAPTMVFLVVGSFIQSAQFLLSTAPMMAGRKYAMSYVAHADAWAYMHLAIAMLVIWRMVDTVSRPVAAWTINAMLFGLWLGTYISPAVVLSDWRNLLSLLVVFPIMAGWCLVRTEATPRDRLNA